MEQGFQVLLQVFGGLALFLYGTAVPQSSSAVTVMVIAFLAAGLLQLRQAVPVVFGANIGTTVTAQLLAFRVESWRYLLLFGGVLLCLACKGWRGRCVGEAVFGFGLLFEGVTVMRSAMEPLLQSPLFRLELARVQQSPLHGLLAGVCMTLTVQSSSATVARRPFPFCWGITSAPPSRRCLPPSGREETPSGWRQPTPFLT